MVALRVDLEEGLAVFFLIAEDSSECIEGLALLRGLDGALKACDCVARGVKGDHDAGVGIGVLRIFFGGPSPESVAHVPDSSNVLLRIGSVTGSGTLVEVVECVGNACLLERHYLPPSRFVLREHRV